MGVKKSSKCSTILIMAVVLTAIMMLITLFLNFTRCTFIDIFVGFAFFGNIYIWKIFNIFLGLRLIGILVVSIIIDLSWELMRLYHFSKSYEPTMMKLRIMGLIFSFISIGIKCILALLYLKLTREKQDEGYLAIDDEMSINEVDDKDYLMNLHYTPMKSSKNNL